MPERMKDFLRKTGLTQAEAGEAIGVSGAQVSRWALGQNSMPRTVKLAFQDVFKVREQWWDDGGQMLLDDMGKLSPQEVRLVELFRRKLVDAVIFDSLSFAWLAVNCYSVGRAKIFGLRPSPLAVPADNTKTRQNPLSELRILNPA